MALLVDGGVVIGVVDSVDAVSLCSVGVALSSLLWRRGAGDVCAAEHWRSEVLRRACAGKRNVVVLALLIVALLLASTITSSFVSSLLFSLLSSSSSSSSLLSLLVVQCVLLVVLLHDTMRGDEGTGLAWSITPPSVPLPNVDDVVDEDIDDRSS